MFRDNQNPRPYCLIQECSRTGRALPHQNAPGAAMLCQAASGRNARLRRLVIHGSGAAGCVMVDTAEPACLNRGSARPAFLFDQRACFPAPTWRCRGRGAQRRGWEERSHPEPRASALARAWRGWRAPDLPRSEHRGTLDSSRPIRRSSPLRHGLQWGLCMVIVGSRGAEHQMMRVFPPPNFDTTLQRSQQFIRVGIRLLTLEPLERQTTHAIAPSRSGAGQGIGANICRLSSSSYSSDEPHPPAMTSGDLRGTAPVSANSPTPSRSLPADRQSQQAASGRGGSHSAAAPDPASLAKHSHELAQSRSHADRPAAVDTVSPAGSSAS